jgi:glycine/D-amino acid oxidase-like deaminating enzyme
LRHGGRTTLAARCTDFDVAVVGAGIVGVSSAAELALSGKSAAVLDMYDQLPYGATGRSAALFAEKPFQL